MSQVSCTEISKTSKLRLPSISVRLLLPSHVSPDRPKPLSQPKSTFSRSPGSKLIVFDKLSKFFKTVEVVSKLTFDVQDKEIFGLLGPNGAGKTTSMLILCSVLKPTSGTVIINNIDLNHEASKVRTQIGVAFQEPVLDSRLTVQQNLEFHADACGLKSHVKAERIKDILTHLDMWEDRKQKAGKLSGGMKKKIEDAKIFVQRPPVAIFDEPTAFLDVPSRHKVWKQIARLRDEGSTILLATNMMDEADKLCDRVGILSKGKLVAIGTPRTLKGNLPKGDVIEIRVTQDTARVAELVRNIPDVKDAIPLGSSNRIRIYVSHAELKMPTIMESLLRDGTHVESIDMKEPSLDDVFLHYTGETL